MSLIEKRYAEALAELAVQENAIDLYRMDLQLAVDTLNNNRDLGFFLHNPVIGTNIKKDTLTRIFRGNIKIEILNLMLLLLDNHRMKYFPGILDAYVKLANRKKNILEMTIISAVPLAQEQLDKIKEQYMLKHNASLVQAYVTIDRSLIGGVRVKIGDRVTDSTVKGRLENLRKFLLET